MPATGKSKMHNKLMKSKEVFKSAVTIGKVKSSAPSQSLSRMKPVDIQLLQLKEREMRNGRRKVAGKALPVAQKLQLHPSILNLGAVQGAQPLQPLSLTDLLLQGEGSIQPPNSAEHEVSSEYSGTKSKNANMFAELSDDENDGTDRPLFELKPSLLSVPFATQRNIQSKGDVDPDDDEDL